jgi:hypothetical protein
MNLKTYSQFINESFKGFDTLGEYIEYLSKDNEYAQNLISEYIVDVDPTVRIANAVNTLDTHTQELILKLIQSENRPSEPVEVTPHTSIRYDESNQTGGKNIFKCFLKVMSAIGQKNCEIDWQKVSEDYLGIFITDSVDVEQTKNVMSRYFYFDKFIKSQTHQSTTVNLYYGVKSDLNLEYGVIIDGGMISLGQFLLTQSAYNFVMTIDLKSAQNLKKFLVSLDLNRLNILSKIKSAMKDFFPGQSNSKLKPTIQNEIISYGFQGLGKWDNGQIDTGELENIKTNLRTYLMQYKWSDKIQFNVIPSDHWIFINIKLK